MNHFVKGNPNLCIGCRTCMIGCVVSHEGRHIFEIDPDGYDFHPKLKVVKTPRISVPVQCKHCESPACMTVCSVGAITMHNNAVVIEESKCIGCKSCADACPFGCIELVSLINVKQMDGSQKVVANKCDLCYADEKGPACVRVCPTAALELVTEESFSEKIEEKRIAVVNSDVTLEKWGE